MGVLSAVTCAPTPIARLGFSLRYIIIHRLFGPMPCLGSFAHVPDWGREFSQRAAIFTGIALSHSHSPLVKPPLVEEALSCKQHLRTDWLQSTIVA